MKSTYQTNSKAHLSKSTTWQEFGHIEPIRNWSLELKKAISKGISNEEWAITGRAVMILQANDVFNHSLLTQIANESGMKLHTATSEEFVNMVNFGSYSSESGANLIYIPQGEWSAASTSDNCPSADIIKFRKELPSYLAGIDSKYPIAFITSGNAYSELDESLRQVGSFDRRFSIPKPSLTSRGQKFISLIGKDICNSSLKLHPGKVGKLLEINFDDGRRQELIALGMKRVHAKESRKLEFNDLVYFALHGSVETERLKHENISLLKRVAIHEAGHALVALIDSSGSNIPEYLTVMPFEDSAGLACDSYSYHHEIDGQQTFKSLRHKIRIQLAGRAAEEIFYGPENISAWGPRSDLVNATRNAKKLIAICGFSSNMECRESNTENLAVIDEDASPAEDAYVVKKVRQLLAQEYKVVRSIIEANQSLAIKIQKELLKKTVLSQAELKNLLGQVVAS
ncbi:hypothetical protein [Polynucleobacter ibericus]|uniref:hypothetical protein n=1 Tax=Polynucleobacter ibericus TaxID=1819725 RepID=UPI001BFEEABE|nr:hypothetical protein [Polynucleobacter ibericus]QWE07902.1 hypothetical protein AOC20_05525 [Polynucleobacter ibericus]